MDKLRAVAARLAVLAAMATAAVPAFAHPGNGIVVDDRGRVWFMDTGLGVWQIDRTNHLTAQGGPGVCDRCCRMSAPGSAGAARVAAATRRFVRPTIDWRNLGLAIALVGMLAVLALNSPTYFRIDNARVIGLQMAHIPFSEIRLDRDLVGAMFGRFVLSPLCLFILLPFIPVSAMSAKVFLMQAGMPAMTNMTILANSVGADADYSTMINCVSLMLGIFFIPFYMYLLS